METMHKMEATETACHEDNGKSKDGLTTEGCDPWSPPYPPKPPLSPDAKSNMKSARERIPRIEDLLAASRSTNAVIPDRTPEAGRLESILEKDSVRLFLKLIKYNSAGFAWGFVITPLTFNQMIVQNALRCAKVALEGKAPELKEHRANPNYMTPFGYFPLHQAAELFHVDMIKLLFHHGASANLRTIGPDVIEGLLPLHVAVENTRLHKFLEDNLFPDQEHLDYIYRLIHLLCLPEMKIFLDTTRLIAEKTDNLLAELLKYMKDGKLVETAVLLLAAQKQIRVGSSFKKNGNSKPNGFPAIFKSVVDDDVALESEIAQNKKGKKRLEAKRKLNHMTLLLVLAISQAGEALEAYIRAHPEVPNVAQVSHVKILEHVSSILKNHGFHPTGECINTENLCPYDRRVTRLSDDMLPDKHVCATAEKDGRKKRQRRGWALIYARRSFFPYWRSVLSAKLPVKKFPSLLSSIEEIDRIRYGSSVGQGSFPIPSHNLGLLGRTLQLTSNHQSRRLFGTAGRILQLTSNHQSRRLFGTAASTVLKLLKNA